MTVATPHHRRSAWALALGLALLALIAWGQVHRVLHAGLPPAVTAAWAGADVPKAAHALGGHDEGGSLCQLLDHLSHGAALPSSLALALPAAAPLARPGVRAAPPPTLALLAFDARGPPSLA